MEFKDFNSDFSIEEIKKIEKEIADKAIPFYDVDKFVQALDYFLDTYEIEKAAFLMEKALMQHPNQYEILLRKACLLNYQLKHKESLEVLNQIENDYDVEFLLTRAQVYFWLNDFQKALKDYKSAVEIDEEGVLMEEVAIEMASIYKKMSLNQQALEVLSKSFKHHGSGFSLVNEIAELGERRPQKNQAVKLLNEIIDEDPYDHFVWYVLGNLHLFHNENDLAIKAFDFATVIEEGFVLSEIGKANALINKGEHQEAIAILNDCSKHEEHLEIIHILLANVLKEEGEHHQALQYVNELLEENEELDIAYYLKAEILDILEASSEALIHIQNAIAINPFDWNYFFLLAQLLQDDPENEVKVIIEAYEQAMFLGGETEVYQEYAEFLSEINNNKKAIEVISNGITNFGAENLAYRKIKYLYLSGQIEEAQAEAADAAINAEQIVKLLGELPSIVLNDTEFITRLKQKIKLQ